MNIVGEVKKEEMDLTQQVHQLIADGLINDLGEIWQPGQAQPKGVGVLAPIVSLHDLVEGGHVLNGHCSTAHLHDNSFEGTPFKWLLIDDLQLETNKSWANARAERRSGATVSMGLIYLRYINPEFSSYLACPGTKRGQTSIPLLRREKDGVHFHCCVEESFSDEEVGLLTYGGLKPLTVY